MKRTELSKLLFEKRPYYMIMAASTSVVWAFAFPLIKLGIAEFDIAASDTGAKTLFAGIRFFAAGMVVVAVSAFSGKKLTDAKKGGLPLAFLLGLVNTALHYFCYYIGLSNQSGSRSAVIDSMSTFILILAACAVFPDENFTAKKGIGCLLGFSGILLVNAGGGSSAFSLSGDGMLMMSALFSAMGGILTRIVTKRMNSYTVTGISLGFGGLLLIVSGIVMGGRLPFPSLFGAFILCCLVGISVYGFSVYNKLISCAPVGEIAIFSSLIPILGVTFSCLLLKEQFRLKYIAAGLLVAVGIFVINHTDLRSIDK